MTCPECRVVVVKPPPEAGSVIFGCACGRVAWWAGSDQPQVIPEELDQALLRSVGASDG